MKVALYGNVCNNFYTLAKVLRNELKIDAHLYLNPHVDFQNRPESDDPQLADNYPEWIHLHEAWNPLHFWKKLDKKFINELSKYDLVFLSDLGVSLIPFIKARCVFYVTGSDLFRIPFPKKYKTNLKKIKDRLMWEYIGFLQRRGIRNAYKIISQPFEPYISSLQQLGVNKEKISSNYFPILMDTDITKKIDGASEKIDPYNSRLLSSFHYVIFHPSRIIFKNRKEFEETWQLKGNDVLFYAFKKFIDKYNIEDACIAMPERNLFYSIDIPALKEIINSLGIEKYIVWLKTPGDMGFPRAELINYYSISNIVADDFNLGMFGSVVVEGLACEKPTFSYVDENAMNQLYPWHPIISSKDPDEIADKLAHFYFNPQLAAEAGKRSRDWVIQFHSQKNGSKIYLENFRKDFENLTNENLAASTV